MLLRMTRIKSRTHRGRFSIQHGPTNNGCEPPSRAQQTNKIITSEATRLTGVLLSNKKNTGR